MTGILDRVVANRAVGRKQFRPATPDHFFALRVAHHLNEPAAADHYVELCGHYSNDCVLAAYLKATSRPSSNPAKAFHIALETIDEDSAMPHRDVAAIRIERRAIAIAIFSGFQLKYPPIARQLSSDPSKALGSAAIFINRIRDQCSFDTAVMETLPADCEAQRSQLAGVLTNVLRARGAAIWHFEKAHVLRAFAHPPLRFRKDVRDVISTMWPEINGSFGGPVIKDALALGLYCQVERLLSVEN